MFLYGQTSGQAGATGSMLGALVPFVLIFAIFYLLIILPAKKKQKQHNAMLSNLKGGERVITAGGIFGTVKRVLDDRMEIEVANNVLIQVTRSSVSGVIDPTTGSEKK